MAETTISANLPVLTLVNVFTVEPARQTELVELLRRSTEETMSRLPGFISANFHATHDGKHVINYAQWRSRADFDAMLADPAAAELRALSRAISQDQPMLCEVTSIHHAPP